MSLDDLPNIDKTAPSYKKFQAITGTCTSVNSFKRAKVDHILDQGKSIFRFTDACTGNLSFYR